MEQMKTKEAIEILARRRTFLEARSTPDMSYDKAEASALELALHAINISGAEAQKIVVEERAHYKTMMSVLLEIYDQVKDGEPLSPYVRIFDDSDETLLQRLERVLVDVGAIRTA
jgi:hypothetical protein